MKNKGQDLMNISLEQIPNSSEIYTSISLEDSFVEASNSFFTTFYNTATYCFNYALEIMISLAGNVGEYFCGTTDHYDVDCL